MTSANTLYLEINVPPFLNPETIGDINKQISKKDKNARFLVLKGSDTVFCAGLDLKWVANNNPDGFKKEIEAFGYCLKQLQTVNCISIAVVNGSVSGGGMGIICSCDYVIASAESNFSLPEGLLGLIPGMILPSLLNRLSPQIIKKMVFTGQKYSSAVAREWGIADEVFIEGDLENALTKAMNTMKSCKKESVGNLKGLLAQTHLSKDELEQYGIDILLSKLADFEMRSRLKDISDFMGED